MKQLFRPIHPFPARMASSIAWKNIPQKKEKPILILDPMAGSGTTLVAAQAKGHNSVGFDRDPLSVMMARVWCTGGSREKIILIANQVLASAQKRRRLSLASAYPVG